jgi:hypothetical protein
MRDPRALMSEHRRDIAQWRTFSIRPCRQCMPQRMLRDPMPTAEHRVTAPGQHRPNCPRRQRLHSILVEIPVPIWYGVVVPIYDIGKEYQSRRRISARTGAGLDISEYAPLLG